MTKLLVISRKFPPSVGGSQTVLKNLFRFFDPEEYIVIHDDDRSPEGSEFAYQELRVDFPYAIRKSFGKLLIPLYVFLIPIIVYKLLRIHRQEEFEKCLILYPDPFFSVSGYIFARLLGIPYIIYFHDLFEEAQMKVTRIVQRILAKIFERRMICNAERFLVVSEGLKPFYMQKYRVNPVVIPHSIDPGIINKTRQRVGKCSSNQMHIVYSGAVYDDQIDAFLPFVKAIRNRDDVKLTITSYQSDEHFQSIGIWGENIKVLFFKNREDVFRLQREADLLYLPLSFDSKAPLEVKTAIPTKFYEYLASMTPILVHAPEDNYLYQFCKKQKLGHLCSSKDPQEILSTIRAVHWSNFKVNYEGRQNLLESHYRNNVVNKFKEIIFQVRNKEYSKNATTG